MAIHLDRKNHRDGPAEIAFFEAFLVVAGDIDFAFWFSLSVWEASGPSQECLACIWHLQVVEAVASVEFLKSMT